jgi:hypothetical protein
VSGEDAGTPILCVLFGAGVIVYVQYQRAKLRESESWRQVTGTITKSQVDVDDSVEGPACHSCDVAYEYEVNNRRYTGKRIEFGQRSFFRVKNVEKYLRVHYPLNARVPVFYDPQNPAEAVLVRHVPSGTLWLWIGIASLVFGVVAGIVAIVRD